MKLDPEQLRARKRAAIVSVVVGLLMLAMKTGAYAITGSAAILSDALESVVHVVATVFAMYSVWLSARPADASHPYGHGKIEYFSAGIEGTLIVAAAVSIVYTAVPQLWSPAPLPSLGLGTAVTAAAAVINWALGYYLIRVGRKEGSLTLVADGKHVLTDSITSFGVVAGLILVLASGWYVLDPIVALLVAGNIVVTGFKLMRQSIGGLMDEADPEVIRRAAEILNRRRDPRWIDVHRLRCWKAGEVHHLDFHLTLPFYMQVCDAHDVETEITDVLRGELPGPAQVLIHHDPCTPNCCHFCAVSGCEARQQECEQQKTLRAEDITKPALYITV